MKVYIVRTTAESSEVFEDKQEALDYWVDCSQGRGTQFGTQFFEAEEQQPRLMGVIDEPPKIAPKKRGRPRK